MRGILMWALIAIVIVLMMLAMFSQFWLGAVEQTIQILASAQAAHIAGIINTMQTAPDDAEHTYILPKATCEVRITPTSVYVKARSDRDQVYTTNLMVSDIGVDEKTIECSEDEERAIRFVKRNKHIEIIQLPEVVDSD